MFSMQQANPQRIGVKRVCLADILAMMVPVL